MLRTGSSRSAVRSRRRADARRDGGAVRFDWYDVTSHDAALDGADRVYLVPPVGDPEPADVMAPFLERARAAGCGVWSCSAPRPSRGRPRAGKVHELLAGGLFEEWAVLRPSWFMQNFTDRHVHAESIRDDGVVSTATGGGRVGFIDADDIAAVAVRALTDVTAPNRDLVLTGPEALGYDEIAEIIGRITGSPVSHRRLTHEQMRDRLTAEGIPAPFAVMLADMDRAIADGVEDRITDTVERVTGSPARSFRAYAESVLTRVAR
ncbi:ergot alkaloid biosynthesis protein [Streptomyces sp. M10(2022)]